MKRLITVQMFPLGRLAPEGEAWQGVPPAARIAEVERLRRVMTGVTGDPDVPMARIARKHQLSEL